MTSATDAPDPYDHLDASIHAVQQRFPGPVAKALEEARGIIRSIPADQGDRRESP